MLARFSHTPPARLQEYVKQQKVLDEIFAKYDTNESGELDHGQLRELLKHVSTSVSSEVVVTDEDEEYVLELCDKSHTGTILRSEALAACATWKTLVETGDAPHMTSSSSCTVL